MNRFTNLIELIVLYFLPDTSGRNTYAAKVFLNLQTY